MHPAAHAHSASTVKCSSTLHYPRTFPGIAEQASREPAWDGQCHGLGQRHAGGERHGSLKSVACAG